MGIFQTQILIRKRGEWGIWVSFLSK